MIGDRQEASRRAFMRFALASPLAAGFLPATLKADEIFPEPSAPASIDKSSLVRNVLQFENIARGRLDPDDYYFVADGADDMKTLKANRDAFDEVQIRARRLVDVSTVDTSVTLFGETMETPILLCPTATQGRMHQDGELASARAAAAKKHTFIVSTTSSFSIGDIAKAGQGPLWFQLYPVADREATKVLLGRAEAAGATVVAVTVDAAAFGNRERQLRSAQPGAPRAPATIPPNLEGLPGDGRVGDPSLTWDFIDWLKANSSIKVVLKGIVTWEDARLAVERGADGIMVSNHGARQEESNRGTLECLPEIVAEVKGRIPVLIDGGFRRGTDIFKALAIGADAIGIGRPYVWGLAAFGEEGVARVLDILRAELVRIMRLAGTPTLEAVTASHVIHKTR